MSCNAITRPAYWTDLAASDFGCFRFISKYEKYCYMSSGHLHMDTFQGEVAGVLQQ